MIDMGFEPDVQKVLDHMPVTNQKPDSEVNKETRAGTVHFTTVNWGSFLSTKLTSAYMCTIYLSFMNFFPPYCTIYNVHCSVHTIYR